MSLQLICIVYEGIMQKFDVIGPLNFLFSLTKFNQKV